MILLNKFTGVVIDIVYSIIALFYSNFGNAYSESNSIAVGFSAALLLLSILGSYEIPFMQNAILQLC